MVPGFFPSGAAQKRSFLFFEVYRMVSASAVMNLYCCRK
jgi:hypothetical protein